MMRATSFLASVSLLPALAGCHAPLRPSSEALKEHRSKNTTELGDGALSELAERFGDELLRMRPEAGGYGVVVRHATWNDPAGGNLESRRRALAELRARVRRIAPETIEPSLEAPRRNLLSAIEREQKRLELGLDHWRFDDTTEPHALAYSVAADLPVSTPMERLELFEAWEGCGRTVEERITNLRRSAEHGRIAPRAVIQSVIDELEEILSYAPVRSPFLDVAKGGGRWMEVAPGANVAAVAAEVYGDAREQGRLRKTNLHLQNGEHAARGTRILLPDDDDPMSVDGRGRFLARTLDSIASDLYPAFLRYRAMLVEELLPRAPGGEGSPYASSLEGREFYADLLAFHATLDEEFASPERLHQSAAYWSDELCEEVRALGEEAFDSADFEVLRGELSRLRGEATAEVIDGALLRARRATPLSGAPARIAVSHIDDDRPWNERFVERDRRGNLRFTYDLPSWAAEAAAFRSGTPGGSWFRSQRGADPLLLEHLLPEALADGWGLHAVALARYEALYSSEVDQLGSLAMECAEACHLLVDTGLHAFGWSRSEARETLAERTLLQPEEIERTLDRVLADPGRLGAAAAVRGVFATSAIAPDRIFAQYLTREKPVRADTVARALKSKVMHLPAPLPGEPGIEPVEIEPFEVELEPLEALPLEAAAPAEELSFDASNDDSEQ